MGSLLLYLMSQHWKEWIPLLDEDMGHLFFPYSECLVLWMCCGFGRRGMIEVQSHLKVSFPEGGGKDVDDLEGPSERDVENQSVLPKHYAAHGSH